MATDQVYRSPVLPRDQEELDPTRTYAHGRRSGAGRLVREVSIRSIGSLSKSVRFQAWPDHLLHKCKI